MIRLGETMRAVDIAAATGVSRRRVYEFLKDARENERARADQDASPQGTVDETS